MNRPLSTEERDELRALLDAPSETQRDVDELQAMALSDAIGSQQTDVTPAQALAVARCFAERGTSSPQHNLLRALAWLHEALARKRNTRDDATRLRVEAAVCWLELARGDESYADLRALAGIDQVYVARARIVLQEIETPEAVIVRAWLAHLSASPSAMSAELQGSLIDVALGTDANTFVGLRARALIAELLLEQLDATSLPQRLLGSLEDALRGSKDPSTRFLRFRIANLLATLPDEELSRAPVLPDLLTHREVLRGFRSVHRKAFVDRFGVGAVRKQASDAITRLEGAHWGVVTDRPIFGWSTTGLPGAAWASAVGGYLSEQVQGRESAGGAAHWIASMQMGADLRFGALHAWSRLSLPPDVAEALDPSTPAWCRNMLLQRLEDAARLSDLPDASGLPRPHQADPFTLGREDLELVAAERPSGLAAWELAQPMVGGLDNARTAAFHAERSVAYFERMIAAACDCASGGREVGTNMGVIEPPPLTEAINWLQDARELTKMEEVVQKLACGRTVLGVLIGARGELLLAVAAKTNDGLVQRTFATEPMVGFRARDLLAQLLLGSTTEQSTPGDEERANAWRELCELLGEAVHRALEHLDDHAHFHLAVLAPGALRAVPWGALAVGGRALDEYFASVTLLPSLTFGQTLAPFWADATTKVCIMGAATDGESVAFGEAVVRKQRSNERQTIVAESTNLSSRDIVETAVLEREGDRTQRVRLYGTGSPFALNTTTEGLWLRGDRCLTARNLAGTRLPQCECVELWASTGGIGAVRAARAGDRDAYPSLVWSFLAAGARAVVDLAWPVHDLVCALIAERFAVLSDETPSAHALARARRDVGRLLTKWFDQRKQFASARDAVLWLDEERRAQAAEEGRVASSVASLAEVVGAIDGTSEALIMACTSPEQLAAFRWWGPLC